MTQPSQSDFVEMIRSELRELYEPLNPGLVPLWRSFCAGYLASGDIASASELRKAFEAWLADGTPGPWKAEG